MSTIGSSLRRRASPDIRSAMRAAKASAERSRANSCWMPGRSTLTATRRGGSSLVSASCTCAIEAAATASPKRLKSADSGLSSSASTDALAASVGNGGRRSCSCCSASATSLPITSGRVARIWPSLMCAGPRLSSARARRTPGGALMSTWPKPSTRRVTRSDNGIWAAYSLGTSASCRARVRAMRQRRRMLESVRIMLTTGDGTAKAQRRKGFGARLQPAVQIQPKNGRTEAQSPRRLSADPRSGRRSLS